MKKNLLALTLGLAFAGLAQASPLTFQFSYKLSTGDVLAGRLLGTLEGDNNTIDISSMLDFVTVNGAPQIALPYVNSATALFFSIPGGLAITSLNGLVQDFIACDSSACNDGFALLPLLLSPGSPLVYLSGATFGGTSEPYDATNWQIAAIPEPGGLALVGLALAGALVTRRRAKGTQA